MKSSLGNQKVVSGAKEVSSRWTFLTNHAHVLLCLAKSPDMRIRDLADVVGITERAVQRIIAELSEEGYIDIKRDGRCNKYTMHEEKHLKHPVESHRMVADLLRLIAEWSHSMVDFQKEHVKPLVEKAAGGQSE